MIASVMRPLCLVLLLLLSLFARAEVAVSALPSAEVMQSPLVVPANVGPPASGEAIPVAQADLAPASSPTAATTMEASSAPPPVEVLPPEGCRPLTFKAMAADVKAFTAQSQKLELAEQSRFFSEAVALWTLAAEQCEGRDKEQAQRNLADSQKVHAAISEQLDSGPQCAAGHRDAGALQEMARKALGERRWNDAAMLFHKAENMWSLAAELCSGSQRELANQHHAASEIDGHNAEYCAPLFDRAREQTQKLRSSAALLSREEKQQASMVAETLWREAMDKCRGNAVQDSARNNAQSLARERGTPWVASVAVVHEEKKPVVVASDSTPTGKVPSPNLNAKLVHNKAQEIPIANAASATIVRPEALVSASQTPALALGLQGSSAATSPTIANASAPYTRPVPDGQLAATAETTPPIAALVPVPSVAPVIAPVTAPVAAAPVPSAPVSAAIVPAAPPTAAATPVSQVVQIAEFIAEDAARLMIYTGQGRVVWASGDKYEGDLLAGQRHGKGTFVWTNGMSYSGDWVHDSPEGQGKLTFTNGDHYEGMVHGGVPQGQGKMRYVSGDSYTGNFNAGISSGSGSYAWKNGQQFDGNWENGHPNGQGHTRFVSGDSYTGNYSNGEPDGQGEYLWANGDKHVGQWKAGKMHGPGSYFWKNGNQWVGIYENGERTSQGNIILKNEMTADSTPTISSVPTLK